MVMRLGSRFKGPNDCFAIVSVSDRGEPRQVQAACSRLSAALSYVFEEVSRSVDHQRNGTIDLFAALDIASGKVIHQHARITLLPG